jgi:hypothetical protein
LFKTSFRRNQTAKSMSDHWIAVANGTTPEKKP